MQIFFERSGGFMGLALKTAVDLADLTVEEAVEWEEMLAAADFFNLPSSPEGESEVDRLIYKISVVAADQEHTVVCTDEDAPDALQPILRRLALMARQ